jgi:hypothetical protein
MREPNILLAVSNMNLFSDFIIFSVLIWFLGTWFQLLKCFPCLDESLSFMCSVSLYTPVVKTGCMWSYVENVMKMPHSSLLYYLQNVAVNANMALFSMPALFWGIHNVL